MPQSPAAPASRTVLPDPPEEPAAPEAGKAASGARRGGGRRRTELAAFLRSRRARITPEAVGLPPGLRRRTPGLRREEVAQLAGVGVTWYTWLEQGRPINASVQVLDAVARVLQLDTTEREHLYRLAGIPFVREPEADTDTVGEETQGILDALDPLPATIYNARYDVRATNAAYRALWPMTSIVERWERNVLYKLFTVPSCCQTFVNSADELPWMVAQVRRNYGRHVGEPAWESFVALMIKSSPTFAQLWASGDVAAPGKRVKTFKNQEVGVITMTTMSLSIDGMAEHRLVVYTPVTDEDRRRIDTLRSLADPVIGCAGHGRRLSEIMAERAAKAKLAAECPHGD
jgi:transcriptional regulator with XRE-family HTH domain